MTPKIKHELRRRAAANLSSAISQTEHRLGRNCLRFRGGDAANAVLVAVDYNFRHLMCSLRLLLGISVLAAAPQAVPA